MSVERSQLAITLEFINFAFVPRQNADHGLASLSQRGNGRTQLCVLTPGRPYGRTQGTQLGSRC
jgi:hypothetical protein